MTTAWSQHGLTLAWRENGPWYTALFLGKFQVGDIHRWPSPDKWEAIILTSPRHIVLGIYPIEQESRDALVSAVLEAMRDE